MTKIFYGMEYSPERELASRDIISVSENDNIIKVLIKVEGDHPELVTIDLNKKTFDVEGYD